MATFIRPPRSSLPWLDPARRAFSGSFGHLQNRRWASSEVRLAYVRAARGVDRPGYHALEVKVNRDGAEVQARRGRFGS